MDGLIAQFDPGTSDGLCSIGFEVDIERIAIRIAWKLQEETERIRRGEVARADGESLAFRGPLSLQTGPMVVITTQCFVLQPYAFSLTHKICSRGIPAELRVCPMVETLRFQRRMRRCSFVKWHIQIQRAAHASGSGSLSSTGTLSLPSCSLSSTPPMHGVQGAAQGSVSTHLSGAASSGSSGSALGSQSTSGGVASSSSHSSSSSGSSQTSGCGPLPPSLQHIASVSSGGGQGASQVSGGGTTGSGVVGAQSSYSTGGAQQTQQTPSPVTYLVEPVGSSESRKKKFDSEQMVINYIQGVVGKRGKAEKAEKAYR